MKFREMIEKLDRHCVVELLNIDNNIICTTLSDCEGVDPYLDREVDSWGLTDKMSSRQIADIYFKLLPKTAEPETVEIFNAEGVVEQLQEGNE